MPQGSTKGRTIFCLRSTQLRPIHVQDRLLKTAGPSILKVPVRVVTSDVVDSKCHRSRRRKQVSRGHDSLSTYRSNNRHQGDVHVAVLRSSRCSIINALAYTSDFMMSSCAWYSGNRKNTAELNIALFVGYHKTRAWSKHLQSFRQVVNIMMRCSKSRLDTIISDDPRYTDDVFSLLP